MGKKKYRVLEQYRVGDKWHDPAAKGEPDVVLELVPAEAEYPLSRGWIEPVAVEPENVTAEK